MFIVAFIHISLIFFNVSIINLFYTFFNRRWWWWIEWIKVITTTKVYYISLILHPTPSLSRFELQPNTYIKCTTKKFFFWWWWKERVINFDWLNSDARRANGQREIKKNIYVYQGKEREERKHWNFLNRKNLWKKNEQLNHRRDHHHKKQNWIQQF